MKAAFLLTKYVRVYCFPANKGFWEFSFRFQSGSHWLGLRTMAGMLAGEPYDLRVTVLNCYGSSASVTYYGFTVRPHYAK